MRVAALALAFALLACTHPAATDAEKAAALSPWTDCVWSNVTRLDDGRSDAASIAYGVAPACAVQHERLVATYLKGVTTVEARAVLRRMYEDGELPSITNAVLTFRAAHPRGVAPALAGPHDTETQDEKTLDAGQQAEQRGDYATALRLWRPLAERGNADAQTELGELYWAGHGVTQDRAKAAQWYRKAADQGEDIAEFSLGHLYWDGDGVPKDYVQAYKWFTLAATGLQNEAVSGQELADRLTAGTSLHDTTLHDKISKTRARVLKARDELATEMTPTQISEAQRQARVWTPRPQTE